MMSESMFLQRQSKPFQDPDDFLTLERSSGVSSSDFEANISLNTTHERIPQKRISKIKRRKIFHPSLNNVLKKNGNVPKFILLFFYKFLNEYEPIYTNLRYYESTKAEIDKWQKKSINLTMAHIKEIFGGQTRRNYENCKILREIICDHGAEMVSNNKKVGNSLSYLVCLEKYVSRLANQSLISRIQCK